jgi:hypothetical protein
MLAFVSHPRSSEGSGPVKVLPTKNQKIIQESQSVFVARVNKVEMTNRTYRG